MRKITPHKGGRKLNVPARVTKEEKEMIDKARKGLSYADYIVKKAKEDISSKAGHKNP